MTAAATNSAKRERMKEPFSRGPNYRIGRRYRATSSDRGVSFALRAGSINRPPNALKRSRRISTFPWRTQDQGGLLTPLAVVARFESHRRAGRDRESACHRHFAGVSPGEGQAGGTLKTVRPVAWGDMCDPVHPWKSREDSQTLVWSTYAAPAVETGGILPVEETSARSRRPPGFQRSVVRHRERRVPLACSGGGRTATTSESGHGPLREPWIPRPRRREPSIRDLRSTRHGEGELAILLISTGGSSWRPNAPGSRWWRAMPAEPAARRACRRSRPSSRFGEAQGEPRT